MLEGDPPGVERGAGEVPERRLHGAGETLPARLAVDRIAHQRMADVLEMDPDLVRAAGREVDLSREIPAAAAAVR
jgi:hypothetical protein